MKKVYTVVALYNPFDGDGGRYCTHVEAETPDEAEALAQRQAKIDNGIDPDEDDEDWLLVAGVLEGKHNMVA